MEQSILWAQWVDLDEYVSKFYLSIETLTHEQPLKFVSEPSEHQALDVPRGH